MPGPLAFPPFLVLNQRMFFLPIDCHPVITTVAATITTAMEDTRGPTYEEYRYCFTAMVLCFQSFLGFLRFADAIGCAWAVVLLPLYLWSAVYLLGFLAVVFLYTPPWDRRVGDFSVPDEHDVIELKRKKQVARLNSPPPLSSDPRTEGGDLREDADYYTRVTPLYASKVPERPLFYRRRSGHPYIDYDTSPLEFARFSLETVEIITLTILFSLGVYEKISLYWSLLPVFFWLLQQSGLLLYGLTDQLYKYFLIYEEPGSERRCCCRFFRVQDLLRAVLSAVNVVLRLLLFLCFRASSEGLSPSSGRNSAEEEVSQGMELFTIEDPDSDGYGADDDDDDDGRV